MVIWLTCRMGQYRADDHPYQTSQFTGYDFDEKPFCRDPPYPHRTSAHMVPQVAKPRLPQLENISMMDFQCQAVLGRGHFGKVQS